MNGIVAVKSSLFRTKSRTILGFDCLVFSLVTRFDRISIPHVALMSRNPVEVDRTWGLASPGVGIILLCVGHVNPTT